MDEAHYQMSRQGWQKNKAVQYMMNPEEVQEVHPLLNMDGVRRGNRVVMRGRGMERGGVSCSV